MYVGARCALLFTWPILCLVVQVVPPKDVSAVIAGYPGCMQVINTFKCGVRNYDCFRNP